MARVGADLVSSLALGPVGQDLQLRVVFSACLVQGVPQCSVTSVPATETVIGRPTGFHLGLEALPPA